MERTNPKARDLSLQQSQDVALSYDFEHYAKLHSPAIDKARASIEIGSFEIAYNQLKQLEADEIIATQLGQLQQNIYNCIESINNIFLIESIEDLRQDVMHYRQQPHKNGAAILGLCIKLIRFKYHDSEDAFSLQQIAQDEFLLDCLANDYYPDVDIERFLTDIRRQLLLSSVKDLEINETYLPLYQTVALQGYLTDYAFYIRDDEQEVVNSLNDELGNILSASECSLEDIANIMLLISMYQPLVSTNAHPALQGLQSEQLPDYLQDIFSLTYLEPLDLESKATKVIALGKVNDASKHVQDQYEESPYPRYSRVNYSPTPVNYRARSPHLKDSSINLDVLDSMPLEILVAGCGTGFHPIQIAKSCEHANVTAIDISRKSLAYAQRLKGAYDANNLQIFQADILELVQIFNAKKQRFHVIECLGVLHHLKDTNAGLAALVDLLVPGGVLNLGLYSSIARGSITHIRKLNEKVGMQASDTNIRQFRRQLVDQCNNEELKQLFYSQDFFNLNGCRDLLFNSQETCFTIPEIAALLERANLEFLGFNFENGEAEQHYRMMFPAEKTLRNLEYWHQLEVQHPQTFNKMYRFHCQKPI
ncbi:MAG: methyltransferase [Pseudomonadales bacterium]|nr:methyltransferase [Pseudomonadales bacterium]